MKKKKLVIRATPLKALARNLPCKANHMPTSSTNPDRGGVQRLVPEGVLPFQGYFFV
jgi:hypothetical protein